MQSHNGNDQRRLHFINCPTRQSFIPSILKIFPTKLGTFIAIMECGRGKVLIVAEKMRGKVYYVETKYDRRGFKHISILLDGFFQNIQ